MLRSRQRVAKKHCDRHRADAARNRGHQPGHFEDRGVDVADEPGLRPVDADVDDRRARLDHLGRHEPWATDGTPGVAALAQLQSWPVSCPSPSSA